MENLFDFLEKQNNEIISVDKNIDISTTLNTKYIINEEHLKHLEKIKLSIYNEEKIKESGLERNDYIRLNSYVGSRLNTDLRCKNAIKKVDISLEEVYEFDIVKLEEIEMDCNIDDIFDNEIKEDKLLIVDGSSLLSTSFYATARDLLFAKTE